MQIRPLRVDDHTGVSELIATTLKISNSRDYTPEYIEEIIAGYSPAFFAERAEDSHFYVVCDREMLIGCGGITGYRGSTSESYILSIFVRPEYQGRGIGVKIMETLESDVFFARAWRTELAASITAAGFYEKTGYRFRDGITSPDAAGVIWMEKINRKRISEMIENSITWAEEFLGETKYAGWCLSFIEDALEMSNGFEIFGGDSAKESAELYSDAIRQDRPERGAFVFFDCLCPVEDGPVNWGHCGISLGDGRVIHAWDTVRIDTAEEIEQMTVLTGDHPRYIGWVPVERVLAQKPDDGKDKD